VIVEGTQRSREGGEVRVVERPAPTQGTKRPERRQLGVDRSDRFVTLSSTRTVLRPVVDGD